MMIRDTVVRYVAVLNNDIELLLYTLLAFPESHLHLSVTKPQ